MQIKNTLMSVKSKNPPSLRIVAVGYYGAGNIGDDLLLSILHKWCFEESCQLTAVSIDPLATRNTFGIDAIDFYDLPGLIQTMQHTDLLILGGGGLFQDYHQFSINALYNYLPGDIAAYARPFFMARQLGVKTLAWAQGVGPLDSIQSRQIVREVFTLADWVSVRDEGSAELLREIGVNRPVKVAPDPVWAWPLNYKENKSAISAAIDHTQKKLAIVIRPWSFVDGWEDYLVTAIKAVVPSTFTLIWVPFQSHQIDGRSTSDIAFVESLVARLTDTHQCKLYGNLTIPEAIEVLGDCDAIFAMRLHAQILALAMGKPTLCYEYDPKMTAASIWAEVTDDLRVPVSGTVDQLMIALKALILEPTGSTNGARALSAKAEEHHQLLQHAITETLRDTQPRKQWEAANFDWISAWRDGHIANLSQVVIKRDLEIESLAYTIADREGQIARLNQALGERDERNSRLTESIAELDAQNARLTESIAELDAQNARLTGSIAELDAQNARLTESIAELDAQNARLNQAVAERDGQIVSFNAELHRIKQSTSWRVTSPLRVTKNLVIAPKRTTYQIFRSLFWRLPASSRQRLHGPRHAFVRFFRGLPTSQAPCERNSVLTDMSWTEFHSGILSKREKYNGIFVQELVIDWNVPLYQRPQHIAAALGRLGYLVIYRTDNWAGDNVDGFREVSENVWITNRYEVEEIQDVVRSLYSTAYANTPELIMKNGKRGVMVYEYIDHIDPEISGDQENIKRLFNLKRFAFEGGADFIVASASKLYDEAVNAVGRGKVILVPNGVDTTHYRDPAHKKTVIPTSLLEFKAKHNNVIGYFGALAPWLWYECIQELVAARPELGFVFIGPDYYGGAEKLPKLSNVLYLGTVDYKILPSYAHQFDICFIPFKPGDIAKTTSPLKLFEYFALEKPVVVTADMNECTAFLEVFSGGSAAELSSAIDAALLVKDQEQFKVRLRELADQNDWIQRARGMEVCFQGIR